MSHHAKIPTSGVYHSDSESEVTSDSEAEECEQSELLDDTDSQEDSEEVTIKPKKKRCRKRKKHLVLKHGFGIFCDCFLFSCTNLIICVLFTCAFLLPPSTTNANNFYSSKFHLLSCSCHNRVILAAVAELPKSPHLITVFGRFHLSSMECLLIEVLQRCSNN